MGNRPIGYQDPNQQTQPQPGLPDPFGFGMNPWEWLFSGGGGGGGFGGGGVGAQAIGGRPTVVPPAPANPRGSMGTTTGIVIPRV